MHQQQFLNAATSQLNFMTSDELREIFGDDDKLEERINEILKPLEEEKDVIINENRSLAESNLEKEPNLIEYRSKVNDLTQEFSSITDDLQMKLTQLKSKSTTTDPESVLARLQAAAAESEEKSEKIADDFFDNQLTAEDFIEQFKSIRMEMHLRKLKAEKMQELLRQGAQRNNNGPPSNYPPSNFYNPMPYPNMPGFAMPMPRPPF